jgi:hypothetical protein
VIKVWREKINKKNRGKPHPWVRAPDGWRGRRIWLPGLLEPEAWGSLMLLGGVGPSSGGLCGHVTHPKRHPQPPRPRHVAEHGWSAGTLTMRGMGDLPLHVPHGVHPLGLGHEAALRAWEVSSQTCTNHYTSSSMVSSPMRNFASCCMTLEHRGGLAGSSPTKMMGQWILPRKYNGKTCQ